MKKTKIFYKYYQIHRNNLDYDCKIENKKNKKNLLLSIQKYQIIRKKNIK